MRLFGYYAVHSVVNQLKKILKPWVVIFILVCGLMGGLIGFGAARLEETSENRKIDEMVEKIPEEDSEEEIPNPNSLCSIQDGILFIQAENIELSIAVKDVAELLLFLVIFALIFYLMISADENGSKIFLMADVNLLFSSPMKPQSVLLFRMLCKIGTILFATFYLGFQIPNLVYNVGISLSACIALLLAWLGASVVGQLLQILLYTVFSTRIEWKKYLSPILWGLLFCVAASYAGYTKAHGLNYLDGAVAFFNAPVSRWIPFIGWLKGIFIFTYENNFRLAFLCAGLLIIGCALLGWGIWSLKADFYEDAMAKSEQTAALQEAVKEGRSAAKRKKDRNEKLRRDSFSYGSGSNVFFYKSMYNRFRFARFRIFTKTVLTYLFLVGGVWMLNRMFDTPFSFQIVALLLGAFAFFRALGNPLEEDLKMSFFVMIPENIWAKLFWSVLAGSANCCLDLLPALILTAILTSTGPVAILVWLFLILSVDAYGSITSCLIGLAIPQSVGQTVKTLIIVLFVYFGLLPDIVAVALGFVFERVVLGLTAAALINLVLSAIFFLLLPSFLEPKKGRRVDAPPVSEEIRMQAKKDFSRIAFGLVVILGGSSLLQIGVSAAITYWQESLWENPYVLWIATFLPIYAVGFPLGIWIMKKVPQAKLPEGKWNMIEMVQLFLISVGCMYVGNLIGNLINYTISLYIPQAPVNPLESYVTQGNLWVRILCLVILAPCLEEYLFRKQLITRLYRYGEKTAVITSAVTFGLFHGNFYQFFYAAALGIIFGYVYLRSGKLRYSIALHMLINFMGSILSVWLIEHANMNLDVLEEAGEGLKISAATWGFLGYVLFMIVGSIAGLLLLGIRWEKIHFQDTENELGKKQIVRTVYGNPGMIIFLLVAAALFVVNI